MAAPSTNLAVTEEPTTPDFAALHAYPFDSDPEFQAGLAHIVRQQAPGSEVSSTSSPELQGLVLQAKCFYYSRKHNIQPPLSFQAYAAWLEGQPQLSRQEQETTVPDSDSAPSSSNAQEPSFSNTASNSAALVAQTSSVGEAAVDPTTSSEPAYPTNFAHIVELITSGQPIPGIEEIPDTVLAGQEAPSTAARRKKPWEKDIDSTTRTEDIV